VKIRDKPERCICMGSWKKIGVTIKFYSLSVDEPVSLTVSICMFLCDCLIFLFFHWIKVSVIGNFGYVTWLHCDPESYLIWDASWWQASVIVLRVTGASLVLRRLVASCIWDQWRGLHLERLPVVSVSREDVLNVGIRYWSFTAVVQSCSELVVVCTVYTGWPKKLAPFFCTP